MPPLRSHWTRLLAVALFAGALSIGSSASAQGSIFGIPVPRIQPGPNESVTITIAPGAPAIRLPNPGLPLPTAPAPSAPAAPPPFAVPPFAAPAEPPPMQPIAPSAPGTSGRLFGVFVGITDYPSANDLPFCADDAHRVQRAFLQAGLMQPTDTVVLTDHAATRGQVASAVDRFQRAAGPDDTIVFFFSGHGNQVPDQDGDEADGADETILLADGPVSDDELRELLASGRGRDFVALDSCYSGGFARDLARLENSVGFYASREDQVSYVAPEYQAGGYLSYHLAQNITRMGGRPIPMWELHRDLRSDFDRSGATARQELTVGVSRMVNTRTVLFDAPSAGTPVMVATR